MKPSEMLKFEIHRRIAAGQWNELREMLGAAPPPEVADLIGDVAKSDRVVLFRLLSRRLAGDVFSLLDPAAQNALLEDMADEEARGILANLSPDDRTALLEEMPANVTQRMLALLPSEERRRALTLLGYPEESVGRLMTTQYVSLRPEWTVAEAIDHIRSRGSDSETISRLYVIDDTGRLVNDLRLRRIILADPTARVGDLSESETPPLRSLDDREEAVRLFKKYDVYALPVIDRDNVLLGIITADDVLDVAEQEATEDIHKGAAISPLPYGYREASAWGLITRRLPWLFLLIGINLISSGIIAAYEETLASVIALAFFIPLLMGSGGNTGSQSATLVVRALSTDELRPNQWLRAMMKELLVGLGLGLAMGLASYFLGAFRGGPSVAMAVGLSMFLIIMLTNLLGMFLPFILIKFKVDPAVASTPLVTTIADAVGLTIYFSIATFILAMAV